MHRRFNYSFKLCHLAWKYSIVQVKFNYSCHTRFAFYYLYHNDDHKTILERFSGIPSCQTRLKLHLFSDEPTVQPTVPFNPIHPAKFRFPHFFPSLFTLVYILSISIFQTCMICFDLLRSFEFVLWVSFSFSFFQIFIFCWFFAGFPPFHSPSTIPLIHCSENCSHNIRAIL